MWDMRRDRTLRRSTGESAPDLNYEYPGRTGDLVLVAPMGFELGRDPGREEGARGGVHGYRGTEDEMQGIFYGWGPAFTKGVGVSRIDAADVYSLACSI